MTAGKEKKSNILVIKLCCLGDIVFFTPVIENLRINYPDAKITLLASRWLKNITPYVNNVDEIIYYDGPYEKSFVKKFISAIKTIFLLRKNKYDLAVVGHRNNFYGLFAKLCGIKHRLGYKGTKHLTHSVDFDNEIHIIDKNLALLTPLNINIGKRQTTLKKIRNVYDVKRENGIVTDKKIIGIFPFGGVNPGTEMSIKRWDLEKYSETVKKISKEYFVILFEGREPGEELANDFIVNENVVIKTMENDLLTLCDIFLSGDTGPLHIAAAMGVNTVALFGPSDPELLKPLSSADSENITIWKKPFCSPCYTPETASDRNNPKYWRGNTFICHTGTHICMKSITVEEVTASINKLNIKK